MKKKFLDSKSKILIPLMLLLMGYLLYSFNLEGQPWHGDEVFINAGGGTYFNLLKNGDLLHPCWNGVGDCDLLYDFSWDWPIRSGHVRDIFVGFGQYLTGQTEKDFLAWSSWHHDFWNDEYLPSPSEFAAGRFFSPILGSLTVVFAYLIGNHLFNRLVGISFALILLFHSLWLWNSRIAMTEVYSGFFILLTILLFLFSIKDKVRINYLILSAITFGLAFNSKLTSFSLIAMIIILIVFRNSFKKKISYNLRNKGSHWNMLFLIPIFLGLFLTSVFISNPYFYPDPLNQLFELATGTEQYDAMTKPSFENDNMFRAVATFHSIFIPYFTNYYDYTSSEMPQIHLSWSLPFTYTSIPLSLFFFVGIGYTINKIKKNNFLFSEFSMLIWFFVLLIMTALSVKVFWAERLFVPLIFPISLIASYGLWRFIDDIRNKKTQITFYVFFMFCHIITALFFWEYIYFSPNVYWSRLEQLTLQTALTQPAIYLPAIVLIGFFTFLTYQIFRMSFSNEEEKRKSRKKILIMLGLVGIILASIFGLGSTDEIIAESTFEKTTKISKQKLFDVIADVKNFPEIFPGKVISVEIINQTENMIYAKEVIDHNGIRIELLVKHTIFPYEKQIIEVVDGDAKGSKIIISFEENDGFTKITTETEIKLRGILKPIGGALQVSVGVLDKVTNKALNESIVYASTLS